MACELIQVNFKSRTTKSRQVLGSRLPFDPVKTKGMDVVTLGMNALAEDAYKSGVDLDRAVHIIHDPQCQYAGIVYDSEAWSTLEVIEAIEAVRNKLLVQLELETVS